MLDDFAIYEMCQKILRRQDEVIDGGFGEEKTIHAATAGSSPRKMLSFTVSRTE
jgi:hypothetical protein